MSGLKRVTTAVSAQVDLILSRFENHEAQVDESLAEMRKASARARVWLYKVESDGSKLAEELEQARAKATRWRERAAGCDEQDRAIECLRRCRGAEKRKQALTKRLAEHRDQEMRIRDQMAQARSRVNELQVQRNLMRTRSARAQAMGAVGACQQADDLGTVFERWELNLAEREALADCDGPERDELEEQLDSEDEHADLVAEWQAMRGQP